MLTPAQATGRLAVTLIADDASPRVAMIEREALARAIDDMAGWIDALPPCSPLHWSFRRSRFQLVECLAQISEPGGRPLMVSAELERTEIHGVRH